MKHYANDNQKSSGRSRGSAPGRHYSVSENTEQNKQRFTKSETRKPRYAQPEERGAFSARMADVTKRFVKTDDEKPQEQSAEAAQAADSESAVTAEKEAPVSVETADKPSGKAKDRQSLSARLGQLRQRFAKTESAAPSAEEKPSASEQPAAQAKAPEDGKPEAEKAEAVLQEPKAKERRQRSSKRVPLKQRFSKSEQEKAPVPEQEKVSVPETELPPEVEAELEAMQAPILAKEQEGQKQLDELKQLLEKEKDEAEAQTALPKEERRLRYATGDRKSRYAPEQRKPRYATDDRKPRYASAEEGGKPRYAAREEGKSDSQEESSAAEMISAKAKQVKAFASKQGAKLKAKWEASQRRKPYSEKKKTKIPLSDRIGELRDNLGDKWDDMLEKLPHDGRRVREEYPNMPKAPEPPMKIGYLPAFLFGGFILVMAVWFIFAPKTNFSASEKRVLADFPTVNAENVLNGNFRKGFESYFADHFPSRNFWVGVNAYATQLEGNNGFNTTPEDEKNGVSSVYKSKDDYLINEPVPENNNIQQNLELIRDFKADIGSTPMTAMFVPSTGYIASNKLPAVHDSYHDDEYFATISTAMQESGISFIDLRPGFITAWQNGDQLYYRTDHHWTSLGAYTAYREFCKAFGKVTIPIEGYEVEKFEGFYGTTYSKSGLWFTPSDTLEVWKSPRLAEGDIHVEISDGDTVSKQRDSMFFYEHVTADDKYPIFLDGNHAKTVITSQNANKGTIIIIKDSFSHCFAPFLAESYSKIILLDMRYSREDITQLIAKEKPEQVLLLYGIDNFATDTDLGHLWG